MSTFINDDLWHSAAKRFLSAHTVDQRASVVPWHTVVLQHMRNALSRMSAERQAEFAEARSALLAAHAAAARDTATAAGECVLERDHDTAAYQLSRDCERVEVSRPRVASTTTTQQLIATHVLAQRR